MSKNLLFLTQTYPRFDGDTAGPFIRELARALVRTGDRLTVLLPHAEEVRSEWDDDGVRVRSFRYAPERFEVVGYGRSLDADEAIKGLPKAMAPVYAAGALRALSKELSREKYDLMQMHWIVPNGMVGALLSSRVPMAVGLHGSDVFLAERQGVRQVVGQVLRRTSVLTGCSPELVDRVCALGYDKAYSRVIPYGVDSEAFSPMPSRRPIWRRKLGIPADAPMIVSVGRMATKKGFQVLIEGLPELFEAHPDVHIVLAGAGDRLEEFRQATEPWRDRFHLPGSVLRDTLPDLYRAADLFTLPAVHDPAGNVDGLPNVILEALASGLPVVATNISGIPLAIRPGKNGLLVPERDVPALNVALSELLNEPERAREMGKAAREQAVSELSWDAVAERYRDAYRLALAH